ncbi:MAG: TonB-dependent receptor [Chitinophagaceae bacterium]|nr:TonB-dependent receptor [Chitinophagaceae bacterium]
MKKFLHLLVPMVAFLFISIGISAQTIKGTLHSPSGEAVSSATISVKGTNRSVVSDNNGNFSIDAAVGNTLIITSVGYQPIEITVNGNFINETLQISESTLNEVVVIGYQSVRKKDLTGAVSVIKAQDVTRNTSTTLAESIQGLAAGVTVRNTGEPGAGAKIDIRGAGTFGSNEPLYVIDGMLSSATPDFNVNDIESIQILKDASAAAIYGSRAANGVIIVTTKKGKDGPVRISGSLKTGIEQFHKRWDLMNSTDFANLNKQAYLNAGKTPLTSTTTEFNPAVSTDWQDLLFRSGNTQDYNISLSGGSNTATYYLSGEYFNNKGTIIDNSFNKGDFRVNTTAKKGRLTFGENALFSYTHQDFIEGNNLAGNIFENVVQLLPTMPLQAARYIDPINNPQGYSIGDDVFAYTDAFNVVAQQRLQQNDQYNFKVRGNAFIDVRLLQGLSYKFNVGIEESFDHFKGFRQPGVVRRNSDNPKPTLNENRSQFQSFLFENTLNFDRQFGDHKVSAVAGISNQTFDIEGINASKENLPINGSNGNYFTVLTQGNNPTLSGGIAKWANLGYFARANYSYKDKYLVSGTFRRDGDSRFSPAYRYGNFPSVSVGWKLNRESFFTSKKINELTLRASYGKLGNSDILSPWQYFGSISPLPVAVFGTTETINQGAINIQLANSNLHWETKKTTNVGVDVSLLENSLSFSLDYFITKTTDVLTFLPIPATAGNGPVNGAPNFDPPVNAASLKNKGIEFSSTYRQNNHRLKWDATLNLTHIDNKVTNLGNLGAGRTFQQIGDARTEVGRSIGEWYVARTNGIFQSQAEVDAYVNKAGTKIQPDAKAGDIRYLDVDGDGTFDANKDRSYAGSPWPDFEGGLLLNFSYKNFNLTMQWYGVFGNKVYDRPRFFLDRFLTNADYRKGIQPWTPENHSTTTPRIGVDNNGLDRGLVDNAIPQSDRWLESGTYVRLRNLELGYTFSNKYLKPIGFKSARIYVSGQNLLTLTKYKGLDPDITGPNIFERGLDYGQYPALRILSAGLQFGF